jgi:acetyltransferase
MALCLRPIRSEDAAGLNELVKGLPASARRNRFHAAVNGLPAPTLDRMCNVDPTREVAWVVSLDAPGPSLIVADLRWALSGEGQTGDAEFALMVAPAWQRRGIARRGMSVLLDVASRRGLRWMLGDVLEGNQPMLALGAALGFSAYASRKEEGLWRLEKRLCGN